MKLLTIRAEPQRLQIAVPLKVFRIIAVLARFKHFDVPINVKVDFRISGIHFRMLPVKKAKVADLIIRRIQQGLPIMGRPESFRHHELQIFLQIDIQFLFHLFRTFRTSGKE